MRLLPRLILCSLVSKVKSKANQALKKNEGQKNEGQVL